MRSTKGSRLRITPGIPDLDFAYLELSRQFKRILAIQSHFFTSRERFSEAIHELRVATRKAQAILKLFQKSFDHNTFTKVYRCLRRIRNKTGQQRDWSIFTNHCKNNGFLNNHPFFQGILAGICLFQQTRGQKQLLLSWHRLSPKTKKLFHRALQSLKESKPVPVKKLFTRVQKHCANPLDLEIQEATMGIQALHRIRIRAKKMRYSLEFITKEKQANRTNDFPSLLAHLQKNIGAIIDQRSNIDQLKFVKKSISKSCPILWKKIRGLMKQHLQKQEQKLRLKVKAIEKWLSKKWPTDKAPAF